MNHCKQLPSIDGMERITRQQLCDNFDGILDKVDKDDVGFVILKPDGTPGHVLCPIKWFTNIAIESEEEIITVNKETVCRADVRRAVEAWNTLSSVGIQPISRLKPGSMRHKGLTARISEYGIDEVLNAIENIRQSDFLRGKNSSGWTVTFDWFVKPNNFPKVHDGNYNNQHGNSPKHESSFDLDEFDNFTMQSCQNRG